jgi:hypothetical protein
MLSLIGLFAGLHLLGAAWLDMEVFHGGVFFTPVLLTEVIVLGLPLFCLLAMTLSAWSLFKNRDTASALAFIAGIHALALALFDVAAIFVMGVLQAAASM